MYTQSTSLYPPLSPSEAPSSHSSSSPEGGIRPCDFVLITGTKGSISEKCLSVPIASHVWIGGAYPSSRISHFSKESWFYLLENKIWVLDVLIVTWLSLLRDHLSVQSQEIHICILTCICTHICDYFLYTYMHLHLY